jgi:hypothetical protein
MGSVWEPIGNRVDFDEALKCDSRLAFSSIQKMLGRQR